MYTVKGQTVRCEQIKVRDITCFMHPRAETLASKFVCLLACVQKYQKTILKAGSNLRIYQYFTNLEFEDINNLKIIHEKNSLCLKVYLIIF